MSRRTNTVGRVDALLDGLDAASLAGYAVEHRRRAVEAVLTGSPPDEAEARRIGRRASSLGVDRARFCELNDEAEVTSLIALATSPLVVGLVACQAAARSGALGWGTTEQLAAMLVERFRPIIDGADPADPATRQARELIDVAHDLRATAAAQRADLEALAGTAHEQATAVARSVEDRRSATRAHLGGVEPIPAPWLEPLRAVLDAVAQTDRVQKTTDSCTSDLARDHQ